MTLNKRLEIQPFGTEPVSIQGITDVAHCQSCPWCSVSPSLCNPVMVALQKTRSSHRPIRASFSSSEEMFFMNRKQFVINLLPI